jgi:hypothetical protein
MGKNSIRRFGYGNVVGLMLIALSVIAAAGLIAGAQIVTVPGSTQNVLINTICNIFNTIKSAIFILGLALMVLGGAVYAGANLMPSQTRGSFQGYGMAMVVGGVIGVAIAVAAPFILNVVVSASGVSGQQIVGGTGGTYGLGTGIQASQICAGIGTGTIGPYT